MQTNLSVEEAAFGPARTLRRSLASSVRPAKRPDAGRASGARATLIKRLACALALVFITAAPAMASEADLAIPDLHAGRFFTTAGQPDSGISAWNLLAGGALVICGTLGISLYLRAPDQGPAGPQVDARRRRDHLPDLQDLPHPAGQVSADAVRAHRQRDGVLLLGSCTAGEPAATTARVCWCCCFPSSAWAGSYCGGLVRHPRQHLRQLPAPPSPRSAASRGTWSTFRCGPACRSACS